MTISETNLILEKMSNQNKLVSSLAIAIVLKLLLLRICKITLLTYLRSVICEEVNKKDLKEQELRSYSQFKKFVSTCLLKDVR
jgi:hypothetical protein